MARISKLFVLFLVLNSSFVSAGVVSRLVEVDTDPGLAQGYKEAVQEAIIEEPTIVEPIAQEPVAEVQEEVAQEPVEKQAPEVRQVVTHCESCPQLSSVASLTGMTVGAPVGLFRGMIAKSVQFASNVDDAFGDNIFSKIIGYPIGIISGAVAGGFTGIFKGAWTGLRSGWRKPFSQESFSLDGDFLDYDPFEITE